jgi:hypothetical protein
MMVNSIPEQVDGAGLRDQLVAVAYQHAFGRAPDEEGLAAYRAFLGAEPFERMPALLSTLVVSEEGRAYSALANQTLDLRLGHRTIAGHAPARVVGLGMRCTTAQLLQDIGARSASYPFDWIFSTPEVVVHCLEDDFALLLRCEEYLPTSPQQRGRNTALCDHRTFRDGFGVWNMFNHHNPMEPSDYAYLQRCVDRFRALADAADPTLFVVLTDNHLEPDAAYLRLAGLLDRFCRAPVALLFITIENRSSPGPIPTISTLRRDGDHELIRFQAVGALGGTRFDTAVDQATLEAIVRRYDIAGEPAIPVPLPATYPPANGIATAHESLRHIPPSALGDPSHADSDRLRDFNIDAGKRQGDATVKSPA